MVSARHWNPGSGSRVPPDHLVTTTAQHSPLFARRSLARGACGDPGWKTHDKRSANTANGDSRRSASRQRPGPSLSGMEAMAHRACRRAAQPTVWPIRPGVVRNPDVSPSLLAGPWTAHADLERHAKQVCRPTAGPAGPRFPGLAAGVDSGVPGPQPAPAAASVCRHVR